MPVAAKRRTAVEPAATEAAGGKAAKALAVDMTVGEGLQTVLASGLRGLRGAARGNGMRPEGIHRFRIGVRRLRALLSAFRDVLPDQERRATSEQLAAIARRYGPTREWDVFIADTLAPLKAAFPEERAIREIAVAAAAARRDSVPPDGKLGADAASAGALIGAAAFLHRPGPEQKELWDKPLMDFATDLLRRHHKRLRKRLKDVDLTDQPTFHEVRIYAKHLRYSVEMFSELFAKGPAETYLDRLVGVQNILGRLNDALTAERLITELKAPARTAGLINGWLAREVIADRDRFPDEARRFRRAHPFWKG